MTNEDKGLKSHPHLFLREHINQVRTAIQAILKRHSPQTVTSNIQDILEYTAIYHDIGKATSFFQEYIRSPEQYTGNSIDKAHTALSVLLALTVAKEQQWEIQDAFAVVAVICGHHSRLPTLPEYRLGVVDDSKHAIDRFASGSNASIIQKQLMSIDFSMLRSELGNTIKGISILKDVEKSSVTIIREAQKFLCKQLIHDNRINNHQQAIAFRLKCQLVYSILLEADKALLAVSEPMVYLKHSFRRWNSNWIDKRIGKPEETETNRLRHQIRDEVIEALSRKGDSRIFSITAPTGTGKTLLAATWALKLREAADPNYYPKVVIVLPFLSVIDQTVNEYKKLLRIGEVESESGWLLASHSISDRVYDSELPTGDNSFLVDTWRSDIIITTYDQLLLSMLEPHARYQMRFHNLCDALIIMDEVQSLPCKLWQPLAELFRQLTRIGNSKLLLMSATLPPFVDDVKPLLENPARYFANCRRYCLRLRLDTPITTDELCTELEERLNSWSTHKQRVLLTFNTRKSARKIRDYIADWSKGKEKFRDIPIYFISADVTSKDRLQSIENIKKGKSCIVVSTQCIEAGVDIDMDWVIRDFAPLDSIIQIAGRCNREGKNKKERGVVEIVDIIDEGKRYSDMIYDEVHLAITRNLLEKCEEINEEDIYDLTSHYFDELSSKKDTGYIHLERFARWQDDVSVRELLRGKEKQQHTFLVIEQDPELYQDICGIMQIKDVWDRREAWRKVAGRMAMTSVSIFSWPDFHPRQIADELKQDTDIWILREGYYSPDKGLVVEGEPRIW